MFTSDNTNSCSKLKISPDLTRISAFGLHACKIANALCLWKTCHGTQPAMRCRTEQSKDDALRSARTQHWHISIYANTTICLWSPLVALWSRYHSFAENAESPSIDWTKSEGSGVQTDSAGQQRCTQNQNCSSWCKRETQLAQWEGKIKWELNVDNVADRCDFIETSSVCWTHADQTH